jgi:general secretion pathway protein A
MYLDFYHLREKPFNTTPDPKFLHLTAAHREALAQLVYGVRESKGFLLLTGEVGTGKTTLLRALLERLDASTAVAFVFNSTLPFDEMLEYILEDFGVSSPGASRAQRLFALNRFLIERSRAGENAVLILDEAQNLDVTTLEQIRLLSNFETAREKLLQIVLVGQPELRERLQRRELRQLYQRIGLRAHIRPLTEDEVRDYIQTRLRVAGGRGRRVFDRQAVNRIAAYSQGVPRVVNILCELCLVIGYADDAETITRDIVEQGIDSLESRDGQARRRRLAGAMKWLVGGAATAALAGLVAPHVAAGDLGNLPHRIVEYLNGIVGAARNLLLQ